MRRHERNAVAEQVITALINGGPVPEREAREWVRSVQGVEREGFAQRITRRLHEARYYHGRATAADDELLSSHRVRAIIKEEVHR